MLDFIKYIQSFSSPALDSFLTCFNYLSQQFFLVLLVGIVYWTIDKRKGEQLAFALVFTVGFSCGTKGVFKISRPFTYDGIRSLNTGTAPGYSFPSADTAVAASIATTFATWTKKPILWILLLLYTILIGFCRMYFGLHFPIDVLGGMILGASIGFGIKCILSHSKDTFPVYLIAALILVPFAFFGQEPDYFKAMGLMLGAVCGIYIEHNYVNFNYNINYRRKGARLLLGIVGIIIIAVLSNKLMPNNNLCYVIEKFLLTFFAVGVYPAIFNKFKF
ncbi:MAG: phosphatase PAP2 family protein [Bacillota bacterium]|nr:phosphatase PAP2 family protein [Bacillota bacterium]